MADPLIKYSWSPKGSDGWTPRDWQDWSRSVAKQSEEVPGAIAYVMRRELQLIVDRSKTKYLTGGGNSKKILNVRSNILRSSVHWLLEKAISILTGIVGTNVWYGKIQ